MPICVDVAVRIVIVDIEFWLKVSLKAETINYVLLYGVCGFFCWKNKWLSRIVS
jgi:hypothetical protein